MTRVDWPELLQTAITVEGTLGDTYSRFHDYSYLNMALFRQQGLFEPVAPYSRWQSLGRQVKRGARAKEVIVPVMVNQVVEVDTEPTEEKRQRISRLVG